MEKEHKTRWGCIIIPLIILLFIGGGVYIFLVYILPSLQQTDYQSSKTTPKLNSEIEQELDKTKSYGNPIKESDPSGRVNPFAPF